MSSVFLRVTDIICFYYEGEYAKDFCSEHNQTLCSPCEAGHYSDHYNIFDRCEECQSCQQGKIK